MVNDKVNDMFEQQQNTGKLEERNKALDKRERVVFSKEEREPSMIRCWLRLSLLMRRRNLRARRRHSSGRTMPSRYGRTSNYGPQMPS